MTRAHSDSGFTLAELLVSLALLGMAAVLVTQGFAADRGVLGRIEARANSGEEVSAAQNLIRARIERLFAQTRYEGLSTYVDFDGSADHLAFLSSDRQGATPDRIQALDLRLTPHGDLTLQAGVDAPPVLRDVRDLEIGYYGSGGPNDPPAWRPQWSRQVSTPQLVRVRLTFPPGDRRVWPELIVRPSATVDTDCVLDTATNACRGRS